MQNQKTMTFEQWVKDRPVGPKGTMGYLMAEAAWNAALDLGLKKVPNVVLRDGLPTLINDKDAKPSDRPLYEKH